MGEVPLKFTVIARCPVTKARVARMVLSHHAVDTPVFMPVGTQGTLKGMTPKQLEGMDCQIMLGNAYHLGNRPVRYSFQAPPSLPPSLSSLFTRVFTHPQGCRILEKAGGLHKFMAWNRGLLTVTLCVLQFIITSIYRIVAVSKWCHF